MSFISYLKDGISLGSIYAIIALGYTMVYGIAKMLNFAHGDVIMVGAFVILTAVTKASMSPILAIILSVVICTVAGVVIDIDSGGGSGNAVPPLVAAIKKLQDAGKPVCVHCDLCGSAAYWVASQCDAIYMDNKTSEVGSIGAYYLFCDDSAQNPTTGEKWISIYAQESEDKNYAYRQALEGNVKPAQEELAVYVKMFQDDVMSGRPGILKDEKGVLTGKMFITSDAIRLGMADACKSLKETAEVVMALAGL